MVELKLIGPSKFIKKTKKCIELKNPDILKVSIKIASKTRIIRQNVISIKKKNNKIFFYHSFDDVHYSGRYYIVDMDMNKIIDNIKKNTITIKQNNWENYDTGKFVKEAIIKITFSDKCIEKLQKLF